MDNEIMVHGGFLNAYMSIQRPLFSVLKGIISQSARNGEEGERSNERGAAEKQWHVYSTGHSLGGALATIFAMDIWRIINPNDGICNIPRLMGYRHVERPMYLGSRMLDEGEGRELLNPIKTFDEIYETSAAEETPTTLQRPNLLFIQYQREATFLRKIIEAEISLLEAIEDGSFITHHMEDFYFVSLLKDVQRMMAAQQQITQGLQQDPVARLIKKRGGP
ncbi:hypothetical protein CBR_g39655 [Chara braunii]|uniref:Fungal lipase-type domain-containing protein n=1 Tax=Chara braunii TaxID=69332 RepID=A0A388K1F1_CHABU|nr:hypothetical protein CBR_g39655 [Chara braunii]|eukprot:GBG63874.1 hypothetical protein CBR_g39655 [Chara braunii]